MGDDSELFWVCLGEYAGAWRARPFLRYCTARHAKSEEQLAYRTYVTAGLSGIAKCLGGGDWPQWLDVVRPTAKREERSGREIADSVLSRLEMLGGERG